MTVREKMEGTETSLPDDMVREILLRLKDVVDLFNCAVSCKQMRRIILEASFLHGLRWPDSTPSFLSGLFIWEKFKVVDAPTFVTSFIPTKHSLFGPHRRNLKSFSPTNGMRGRKGRLLHNAVPLVARHGLVLLLRLDMPDVHVYPALTVWLAVCNLFSGACDELPPLKCDWNFDDSGYAILTSADCSSNAEQQPSTPPGYSAFFKVLIVETDVNQQPHNLHKFTSGEPSWSGPSKISTKERGDYWQLKHPRAVICRGTAHWLIDYSTGSYSCLHTVDVDPKTCHVSVTKIETPTEHITTETYDGRKFTALIVDVDGLLSVVRMRGSQLERWTRQEDGDPTVWLCAEFMELKPHMPLMMHSTILQKKGCMLLVQDVYHYRGGVYTIDLQTGAREEVAHFTMSNCRQVVPLEMDWPTLFFSRLNAREL